MTAIEVRETLDNPWRYFDQIDDVTNLDPGEEQGNRYEAVIDGQRVGMAVVDTFGTAFISRLVVDPEHRRQGVATALLEHLRDRYGTLRCRVHENNDASQALVEGFGFVRTGKYIGYDGDRVWEYEL